MPDYRIIETEQGPMISHSRVSVYDVMEKYDQGRDMFRLCVIFDLTPLQVMITQEYIEQHRKQLEPELKDILKKKAELQRHYEAIAAERQKRPVKMTPKRAAFYALREKNRRLREEGNATSYS